MVKSALVVTFTGPASEQRLWSGLAAQGFGDAELTCGAPQGHYLPAVLTSGDARHGAALLRALESLEGVGKVDVVAIDFDDETAANTQPEE